MTDVNILRKLNQDIVDAIDAQAAGDVVAPHRLLTATNKLQRAVEPPAMILGRQPFHTIQNLGLMMAKEMGLFSTLAEHDGQVLTAAELAQANDFDELFVARIMREATATGFADELGSRKYQANAVTLLHERPGSGAFWHYTNNWFFGFGLRYKDYIAQMKGKRSTEDAVIPFVLGNGENTWQYWEKHPEEQQEFNLNMGLREELFMTPWNIKFPLRSILEPKTSDSAKAQVTIVDVGGNAGHDLRRVILDWPDFSGRLILQDRPVVIDQVKEQLHARIEPMCHDFFTTQPIKGAEIYHIKTCLHNWNNAQVVQIISQIAQAMSKESRLLINEIVLADEGETSVNRADMDLCMLLVRGSMERDLTQWKQLLSQVVPAIRVVKIWAGTGTEPSTIEIMLED